MLKLVKDKRFYAVLLSLALPMAAQDLIKFGLNMMDNVMVGALSSSALSAVTLANQPFFLFSMLCFGLASGGAVLISQYYGKNDMVSIRKIISITLFVTTTATVIIGLCVLLLPRQIMTLFTPFENIIDIGVDYLRITGWTYFLFGVSNSLMLVYRSVHIIKPSLIISIIAFFINVFLNWVLIFGNLGAPALGVRGAALATLSARVFECAAMVIYIRFIDKKIRFRFKNMAHLSRPLLKDFFKFSVPVACNEFFWGFGITMLSVVFGHIGENAVTATSIASAVQQLTSVLLFGIANASTIVIGREVGAGQYEKAKSGATTVLFLSTIMGVIIAGAILLLRQPILSLYNISLDIYRLTMNVMAINALCIFLDSFGITSVVGVMRGGGDTKYAMLVDTLSIWAFALPLGALAGLVFHAPIEIVYLLIRSDVIVRIFFCVYRIKKNKWIHNLTRSTE